MRFFSFFLLDFSLSVFSFGDFAKGCGFNLSNCEKREMGEKRGGKKTDKNGGEWRKYESEWVEMKPKRDERVRREETKVWPTQRVRDAGGRRWGCGRER